MDAAIPSQLRPDAAYSWKFGKRPSFPLFKAPPEAFEKSLELMRMAVERGTPLTEEEIESIRPEDPLLQFDPEIRDLVCL